MPHRPPHRQATCLAYLGLEGSNPHFPPSIHTLLFADAPSALQDHHPSLLSFLIRGHVYAALFHTLVATLFPSMWTATIVPLLSSPMSQCRMRPSDSVFP